MMVISEWSLTPLILTYDLSILVSVPPHPAEEGSEYRAAGVGTWHLSMVCGDTD